MKTRKILTVILAILALTCTLSGCTGNKDDRNVVYEDMKAAFEKANLLSANIGIFTKIENDGSVSYGECGSGVVFEKKDGVYYALTAAHVISVENAQLLVFTVNTEMKTDIIPGVDYNVLSQESYESMYKAETVYVSKRDDLAVIRFSADENLSIIEIADADPAKGDRIMCVGNPENEWFAVSYGKVTSDIEKYGEAQGFPSNAMKHSAYIQVGSSGGAAINEEMKLVGITPGASLSLNGKTFKYGVLIPVSEIRICLDEWNRQ
ncbi:MAG: trypsin-like peptidase domain-containing protein [Clostridia bacterium]|nr:trypsin-like peptidase domain-containing protein [Clostridia bacterium]